MVISSIPDEDKMSVQDLVVLWQFRLHVEDILGRYDRTEALNILFGEFPNNSDWVNKIVDEYDQGIRLPKEYNEV